MERVKIDPDRLLQEFCRLVQIDSLSFHERAMADCLREKLTTLGFSVEEDRAGAVYGSETGNLYGFLKGSLPGAPVLLSAHMDTVEPGAGKAAAVGPDGRITARGETILGADDVCGLVEILEAVRCLREQGIPHRDVEVLFPIAEERFIKGTDQFDFGKLRAKEAYVLDLSGSPGAAAIKAPSLISFTVTVKGKAAHAGFNPEQGIHAVRLMSRALGRLPMGRNGDGSTMNIGRIEGGTMPNIVPELCTCAGEIRSFCHARALELLEEVRETFRQTLEGSGGTFQMSHEVNLTAYEISREEPVVRSFARACRMLGLPGALTETFGGSDNHNFVLHGIRGIVISCGMHQCHSTEEYTTLEDLEKGTALAAALLTEPAAFGK